MAYGPASTSVDTDAQTDLGRHRESVAKSVTAWQGEYVAYSSDAVPRPPFALDGTVTVAKLRELLAVQTELPWLDYKKECDISRAEGLVEIMKDIGAMMIDGGYLVIGANDTGTPLGIPIRHAELFDQAKLSDKVAKYVPHGFDIRCAVHNLGDSANQKLIALVWIAPHPDGWCIFARNGEYTEGGKQKIAFRKGDVYARHGSRSEPWGQADIDRARTLLVAREKHHWRAELADELYSMHHTGSPSADIVPMEVTHLPLHGFTQPLERPVQLLPRPTFLAGRENLLADLEAQLTWNDGQGPRTIILSGLGGVGKTSVAIEYAHRQLKKLRVIWQLSADEPEALVAGFRELAAQLGARDQSGVRDPVTQVHRMLAARPADWLLIFDNAPGPADLQTVLPPAGVGQVLVTSQNSHWSVGEVLDVPVLDKEVSAGFLRERTGSADQDSAAELAVELGGLPLALEQAASYMLATGRDIAGYLAIFRKRRTDLLARGEPAGYRRQVATTWTLAIDQLQQTTSHAIDLLRLLACCAPESIPLRLLLQPQPGLSGPLREALTPLLEDTLVADDAITALRRFSLISPLREGLVSVHRLVQAVTLRQLSAEQAGAWRQAAGELIEAALPANPEEPGNWPIYVLLLPHAQATLPLESDGMARLASFLGSSGSYRAARALQQRMVAHRARIYGSEHPSTLIARANLAAWAAEAGDPAGARDEYAELLSALEHVFGAEHAGILSVRANLASCAGKAGDPQSARDQYANLLPLRERISGADHSDTLVDRANLALWTGEAGDPAKARDLFAKLLPIRERVSGPEHPETLTARANLARWTGEAGDPASARDQYAALLAESERIRGAEHPRTLTARANLARWTGEAGDPASARDQYAALLSIRERSLGTEHVDTLAARANLARWTGRAGDPAKARDQYAELLPDLERVLGPEHPTTLTARANLANNTGEAGDPGGALDQYAALLPIRERVLGAEHPSTLAVRANLASWTGEAGDPAGALDQFAALLPIRERVLGAEHPSTLAVRANLEYWAGRALHRNC